MTTDTAAATLPVGRDPAGYDDDALDRLADLIADRLAARLGGLTPPDRPEPLVDAAEIARLHVKTRSWTRPGRQRDRGAGPAWATWTQRPAVQTTGRRAAFATLLLGGGRASATGSMIWRDVDLANGRFAVGPDKTDAGMREVDMLLLLPEVLAEHKAASVKTGPNDPVFVTTTGVARSRHNLRQDVVDAAVVTANRLAEERGIQPLPLGITPHKLRHTYASILVAIGKDPTYVMQQLGHTDPAFTLRVYSHMMRRSEDERERLKALVEGHDWAQIGHKTPESAAAAVENDDA